MVFSEMPEINQEYFLELRHLLACSKRHDALPPVLSEWDISDRDLENLALHDFQDNPIVLGFRDRKIYGVEEFPDIVGNNASGQLIREMREYPNRGKETKWYYRGFRYGFLLRDMLPDYQVGRDWLINKMWLTRVTFFQFQSCSRGFTLEQVFSYLSKAGRQI